MKKILFSSLVLLIGVSSIVFVILKHNNKTQPQSENTVVIIDLRNNTIIIDSFSISINKPDIELTKTFGNYRKHFATRCFDDMGIAFTMVENRISYIEISLLVTQHPSMPKTAFSGDIYINDVLIDKESNPETFEDLFSGYEFFVDDKIFVFASDKVEFRFVKRKNEISTIGIHFRRPIEENVKLIINYTE